MEASTNPIGDKPFLKEMMDEKGCRQYGIMLVLMPV